MWRLTSALASILILGLWTSTLHAHGIPVECGCNSRTRVCTLPGASDPADTAGAESAGSRLAACIEEAPGYTFRLVGDYLVHTPIVLPRGTSLVGAQRFATNERGQPLLDQGGEETCDGLQCGPVLVGQRTVIRGSGVCPLDPAEFPDLDEWWFACWVGEAAVVTVQANGGVRRLAITQDAHLSEDYPSVPGLAVTGNNAQVSEVDAYGNSIGLRVLDCEADAIDRSGDLPRCTAPTRGVEVSNSVFRYNVFYPAGALAGYTNTRMAATFDSNVILGFRNWSGLFVRVFEADDCTLDLTTRNNWLIENWEGVSIETRYGGERNRIRWRSEGDRVERSSLGVYAAGCEWGWAGRPCFDNSTEVWFDGLVVRDPPFGGLLFEGYYSEEPDDPSSGNTVRLHLRRSDIEGSVSCAPPDDRGNAGALVGSRRSILRRNTIHDGYIPGHCTTATSDSVLPFIDEWLVLGMYDNPGGALPGADALLSDFLADGVTTQDTIVPSLGDVLDLPLEGGFVGPGTEPIVGLIEVAEPLAGTADVNGHFSGACLSGEDWVCDPALLDDVFDAPPANVAAYLFTYVENLTGAPLPLDLALAMDDSGVVAIRRVDDPAGTSPAEVVAVIEADRWYGQGGVIQYRVPVTLPEGVSLLSLLVAEGHGAWGARAVLVEAGTSESAEAQGLIRYSTSPP